MTNFTPEIIEKAKTARSTEELLTLAKENNVELTDEEAKVYFEQLHSASGELSDDELDNVAGGGCKSCSSGRTVVTSGCRCFTGCYQSILHSSSNDWKNRSDVVRTDNYMVRSMWYDHSSINACGSCRFLEFEGQTGVCGKS